MQNFMHCCAGNFFFAGARLFLRSLEAAIFLFSRVARIPDGSSVLPAICTEGVITLGAELVIKRVFENVSRPLAVKPFSSWAGPLLHAICSCIFDSA